MSSTPNPLVELSAAVSLGSAERASGAGAVGTSRTAGDRPVEHWCLPDVSHKNTVRGQPPVRAEGTRFFHQAQRREAL